MHTVRLAQGEWRPQVFRIGLRDLTIRPSQDVVVSDDDLKALKPHIDTGFLVVAIAANAEPPSELQVGSLANTPGPTEPTDIIEPTDPESPVDPSADPDSGPSGTATQATAPGIPKKPKVK